MATYNQHHSTIGSVSAGAKKAIKKGLHSQPSPQPQSLLMEVYAHSHTPRKKWSHYFWEFLMLFLAVFRGFWQRISWSKKQIKRSFILNLNLSFNL